jgi:phenylpyruvate tautomerase PptA (4-oxalocrotonate tautomerase family)
MPLVRIDMNRRPDPAFAAGAGQVVYEAMRATIDVPPDDNFQVITEHDGPGLVADPTYLGIARTKDVIIIQITLNEGRTTDKKKALFAAIADGIHAALAVRKEDVFISLVEVRKENWSFGNGVAQYA